MDAAVRRLAQAEPSGSRFWHAVGKVFDKMKRMHLQVGGFVHFPEVMHHCLWTTTEPVEDQVSG